VRKNVARTDHVVRFEPTLIVVLAAADKAGLEAMRKRLAPMARRWWEAAGFGPKAAGLRLALAGHPLDGQSVAQLMQEAKNRLLEPDAVIDVQQQA
jgi:hypothetical protein